ncbi:MAG: hypothetical protein U9R14_01570 [Patescibacteria group bacterium]|nr:hypothetical protein [Patescibacteria group bacterium]
MTKYIKFVRFSFFCLIGLLFFVITNQTHAQTIDAPTIIDIKQQNLAKFLILGLTPAETEVLIYINGSYIGLADINQSGNKTDNFYYEHDIALPESVYKIMAVARDKTSLVLSPLSIEYDFIVPSLPAPTMIKPNKDTITGKVKPLIKGLTVSGSFVRIYIDGIYNGKTNIVTHKSGTANFAYQPFLNLSHGWHIVWAVAEDEVGRKSDKFSNVLNFKIEKSMPAPTLFTPVINNKTKYNRPFIVGLAKNNSLIRVFIDHKLDGQFQAVNHESGAADFAYLPFQPLTKGDHLVYTIATDSRDKESRWSNIIYFTVKQPAIAQAIQEEAIETVAEIKEPESLREEPAAVISSKKGIVEEADKGKDEIIDQKIQKLIKQGIEEEKVDAGFINEGKEKQGKLNFNMIIFIVFLLGIIAWIFWVNRELIKERRAQARKDAKNEIKSRTNQATPLQDVKKEDVKNDLPRPPQEQPPLV